MSRKFLRTVAVGMILLVFVLCLSGCGNGNQAAVANSSGDSKPAAVAESGGDSKPAVATINVLSSDDFSGFRKSVQADFESKNPNIKINFMSVGYDALHQKEVTAMEAGGNTYDLIDVDCIWTPEYVTKDYLENIDNRVSDEMKKDIVPAALDIIKYKDHYFGLPMFNDVVFFYYNTELLEKAGIKVPPKTWTELTEVSKSMQQKGIAPFGTIWGWAQAEGLICYYTAIVHGFGGDLVDKDGKPAVNTEANLNALTFMADSISKDKISDPASVTSDDRSMLNTFVQGKTPFGMNWSFAWSLFNDPKESKVPGKIKVGLVPGSQGVKSATCAGSMGFAITKNSKNKDAAWKYIEYLSSKEIQKKQAIESGALPIWISLYNDKELQEKHPALSDMAAQLTTAYNRPSIVWYNEFSAVLQVEIQNALTQKKTPKAALDDAQKKLLEISAQNK